MVCLLIHKSLRLVFLDIFKLFAFCFKAIFNVFLFYGLHLNAHLDKSETSVSCTCGILFALPFKSTVRSTFSNPNPKVKLSPAVLH